VSDAFAAVAGIQTTLAALRGTPVATTSSTAGSAGVFEAILASQKKIWALIKTELLELKEKYGDKRKSVMKAAEDVEFSQEDEDRAADDVDRLHDIYARRTPGDFISGNFRVPLKGRISAEFGMHRVFNNVPMSPHGGVDIAGRQGAMVAAAQGGIVALADDLFLTGNTVVLDHGCGLFTLYGHLSTILVPVGAVVRRGEILGLVGATGRATGPHLHWGARLGKLSLDPQSLTALNLEAWMRPEPDQ